MHDHLGLRDLYLVLPGLGAPLLVLPDLGLHGLALGVALGQLYGEALLYLSEGGGLLLVGFDRVLAFGQQRLQTLDFFWKRKNGIDEKIVLFFFLSFLEYSVLDI